MKILRDDQHSFNMFLKNDTPLYSIVRICSQKLYELHIIVAVEKTSVFIIGISKMWINSNASIALAREKG